MRKPFIAGNWKMNTNREEATKLASGIVASLLKDIFEKIDVAVAPPFTYLYPVHEEIKNSGVRLAAQNCYFESKGAYTGEVSPNMLKDVGCSLVIIGHSERRHILNESDETINKKVKATLEAGLFPILCVGETLEERESNKTFDVIKRQVESGIKGISTNDMLKLTIAYEPVWAIGTGKTARPYEAQEVHAYIRKLISTLCNDEIANKIRIQYGGSVKPSNISELIKESDIDGALVGGASLELSSFVDLVKGALK